MNIYESCPVLENERFLLRAVKKEDCEDLLKVYSDKNALPFFNSDNCDGDNFYYATKERMAEALDFWNLSYENRWFARLSIVDKALSSVIGTVELCLRVSEDAFHNMGILRVDVRSDYEKEDALYDIITLITPQIPEWLGCTGILTKAPLYAVERINAVRRAGFNKSEHLLIGKNGYAYDGYWTIRKGITDMEKNPIVTIKMKDGGVIRAELYPDIAPVSVNNFISLINRKFYDGLIFHRVIRGFMIQGGCPEGNGMGGPGYQIKGEFSQNGFENNLKHTEGVLSMARAMDPDSAGSQFFIMHKTSPHLDGSYAAFGKVIEGMDVVNRIAETPTYDDRPYENQVMETVTVECFGVEYPEPEKL